jgi:hypothetical protein
VGAIICGETVLFILYHINYVETTSLKNFTAVLPLFILLAPDIKSCSLFLTQSIWPLNEIGGD